MKKIFFKATLTVVCVVAVGTGSWKAYSAYIHNQNEADLLMENVEALSTGTEAGSGYYQVSSGNCSAPCSYRKWVTCKSGGTEECSSSDCC